MEISKWSRRRYVPEWGENRTEDEPVVVVFTPPTVGWVSRWRELAMSVPDVSGDVVAKVRDDREFTDGLDAWTALVDEYRSSFFLDLISAVESLTLDGKQVTLEQGVAFIEENEGLREEVFNHMMAEGQVSRAQGKG